jgi:hypothetical protein
MNVRRKYLLATLLIAIILSLALLPLATARAQEPDDQPGRRFIHGQVVAIEAPGLTVRTPAGEQTLLTNENTRYRVPGVQEPSLSDIHVDDHIAAKVEPQEDGSLLALTIGVVTKQDLRRHTRRGRVEAVEARGITLATPDGFPIASTSDKPEEESAIAPEILGKVGKRVFNTGEVILSGKDYKLSVFEVNKDVIGFVKSSRDIHFIEIEKIRGEINRFLEVKM